MAEVTFTPNHVPPPACYPSDINGLLDTLTTGGGITGTIPDQSGGGVFVGSAPPPSALTNKVWYKIDGAGRPLGVYMFYNGNWRKVYTGAALGEVRMYIGTSGTFDGTGRGIVGSDLDGWAVCNGNNGTPNLHGVFPCGSAAWDSVNGWEANPSGGANTRIGGQGAFQITSANLPPLQTISYYKGKGGAAGGSNVNVPEGDGTQFRLDVVDRATGIATGANTTIDNTPPWLAMAFIMFVGYQ